MAYLGGGCYPPVAPVGFGAGRGLAFILVLFVLLVIILRAMVY